MFDPTNYNELTVTESSIPGLFVIKLPVHGDNRGWFKENYQKEKMEALGLPSFDIVQNNISFNDKTGALVDFMLSLGINSFQQPMGVFLELGVTFVKEIASAEFSRTRLIRVRQFSSLKV